MNDATELKIEADLTKRYYAFAYDIFYPSGGLRDLRFTSDSFDECIDYLKKHKRDYHEIFDTKTKILYNVL